MNQIKPIQQQKLPWKGPKLYKPSDNDLSKRWAVNYYVWSFDKNKLVRKRYMVTGSTVEARLEQAKAAIEELTNCLQQGTVYVGTPPEGHITKQESVDMWTISPRMLIYDAIPIYLNYTQKTLAPNTFKSYRTAVMNLQAYLQRHGKENMSLGNFGPADALDFLHELITVVGLCNRTHNNIKGAAGTFFNYFIKLDRSRMLRKTGNPFEDPDITKLPQVQNKHQSYSSLQQDQYRELCLESGLNHLLTFCRWMYYTLMRPHEELRRLRVRDVRVKTIYVTGNSSKTNQAEYVDIPLPLELLIQQQKIRDYPGHYYVFSASGEPGPEMVGNKFFYRRHARVIEKMNLIGSGHDMYSWKHTGAIALWTATKDIELVRHQARHTDIKQTIDYLRDLGIRLAEDQKIHQFPVF